MLVRWYVCAVNPVGDGLWEGWCGPEVVGEDESSTFFLFSWFMLLCPTTLVLTLNWQTLERRRIIKQAMTFYKILNNIIKISPPSGLLTRSHNRHHYIVPRSRLNTVVYSFYPRAIRIWNTIPKEITEITKPESFQAAISKLPFTTPVHIKCL